MPKRRMVNIPVNKKAEGESFSKELEKQGRYMVGMSLISLKTIGKYDTLDRTNEFYFMVDGGKIFQNRIPNKGYIQLRENQVFESKTDEFTLWCEFVQFKAEEERIIEIKVQLREEDIGKDEILGEAKYTIKCPQETDYVILDSKDEKTKAKLKIYSRKTLY